jgi:SAM-dependent methyltransferase
MEALTRGTYQGVVNIIRFNWHFYVIAGISVAILVLGANTLSGLTVWFCILLAVGIMTTTFTSLIVSHYIYDRSGLYDFSWIKQFDRATVKTIVSVHAGFDETSRMLKNIFSSAELKVFDFYDPSKHTEVSVERARKAYPAFDGTVKIASSKLPVANNEVDIIFNIFALHEVRNRDERIGFLNEQFRALCDDGKVVVVEHLRDVPNFLAYNIGFFHFLSEKEWGDNFCQAGLNIDIKFKITPFITVFILRKA